MKRTNVVISIIACAFLMPWRPRPACGQQLHLDDNSPRELNGEIYDQLPISESERATLRDAIKAHNYAPAEALLIAESKRQPKSPELLTTLGSVFFLDGKYLNCVVAMKKGEALAPLAASERFTLALSYIILNHRDWARPELENLANANPHSPLYPYWLGRIDYDGMQFRAAEAHLRKALELDPKFMKAYDNLGLTEEALGQLDDAIGVYQQAVTVNRSQPTPSPWPPLNLGTLLVKIEKLPEAESCLQESLKYDSRFPKAHFQMGLLLEKQKMYEEACNELLEAVQNDPSDPDPHFVLGRIYTHQGDKAKAEVEWQTFQKLKHETPQLRPH